MDERPPAGTWRRVDELFTAALELDPHDRRPYVDEACPGEPGIREAVLELLAAAEGGDAVLARSEEAVAAAAADAFGDPDGEPEPGHRVGAYRIVRRIARGGMGSVYLARRDDDAFEQRVALKVLRRGLDTDDVLARFRAERQILASLSHPNIASLLDGGATRDGRPYLVMEYVEGVPVDVHCDRNRLPVDARLRLFRTICDAVAHAHRNLVVHRDLKPGNVLVTPDGVAKLLDFGIAKLLAPDRGLVTAPLTRTGVRLLSPLYASPEQVEGGAITTATDVYALGVLLYELVTGHHPHRGGRGSARSSRRVERAIAEEPPTDPAKAVFVARTVAADGGTETRSPAEIARARSTRPEALRRRLSGDLGAILQTTLRKDPERRYGTAEALSADVGRLLAGRPVTARKDTWRYRAGSFVRRHSAGVAAAVLVLVTLVAGIAATTWQARKASEAAGLARVEARNAEEITDLLVGLFRAPDATEAAVGDTLTARAALDRGVERVREELAGQPEVRARMLHVAGEVYASLGLFDRGRPLLREALELRRELFGGRHREVAESLEALAGLLREERDFRAAVPLYREELDVRRALLPDTALEIASTAADLGLALRDVGRADTAVAILREALALKRRRLGPDHADALTAQAGLAYVLRGAGELEEAESLYRDVLPRLRRSAAAPGKIAMTLNNLAYLLKDRGEPARAAETYRRALREARRAHGPGHPSSATVMVNLASALQAAGDSSGAVAVLRERLRLTRIEYAEGHWRVGSAAHSLGVALDLMGRHLEAERFFRETLAVWREELGADHRWTARARGQLGGCLLAQGRYAEAERHLLESHAALSEALAPDAPWARQARERLATLYEAWGRREEAERFRRPPSPVAASEGDGPGG